MTGWGPSALAVLGSQPADWPSSIHATLACGAATVTGHATIHGVPTIKINSRVRLPSGTGAGHPRLIVRYTLYASPATYLPVRMVSGPVLRRDGGQHSPASVSMTENFRWLPPTTGNVAGATVPIPAGFRELHFRIYS